MGNRSMVASIDSVHYDVPEKVCEITGRSPRSNQIHFILKPFSPEGWKNQNFWLYDSLSEGSSWHDIVRKFINLNVINEEDVRDAENNMAIAKKIFENLKGQKVRFVERKIGKASGENWYPTEIVK